MDIPAPAAAPMDAALVLLDNLEGLSTEQKKSIFPVLGKLLNNIVENPLEDKYRAINKSNKKIQATFCNQYGQMLGPVHAAAVELLEAMACSLEDEPVAPASTSAPTQASTISRRAKADPNAAQACDLADARRAQAEAFKSRAAGAPPSSAPPAASPTGYPA